MQLRLEIPDSFWSLFRSVNREIYIDALLCINEEYEYSNYFLTREVCLQVLSDMNARRKIRLEREETETDFDLLETTSSRILNWLVKTGWLKRIEDFTSMTTNIVIPDYAAVMIGAESEPEYAPDRCGEYAAAEQGAAGHAPQYG